MNYSLTSDCLFVIEPTNKIKCFKGENILIGKSIRLKTIKANNFYLSTDTTLIYMCDTNDFIRDKIDDKNEELFLKHRKIFRKANN